MNILEIKNLKKSFGTKEVLKDVSFSIPEGTIFGFVGMNGAGKTTTMKLILGLISSDAGEIRICGEPVRYGGENTNRFIGYLPDVPEFYNFMSTMEYLEFIGDIAAYSGDKKARAKELIELVGLTDAAKRRIKGFSRGMKQRLGIAQALFAKPRLLICDEPTSALDPLGRKEILELLQNAKQETTVLFSTHILSDVERIADEIAMLHDGTIKFAGRPAEILGTKGGSEYMLELADTISCKKILDAFPGIVKDASVLNMEPAGSDTAKKDGISDTRKTEGRSKGDPVLLIESDDSIPALMSFMSSENIIPVKLEKQEADLEKLFMNVISGGK